MNAFIVNSMAIVTLAIVNSDIGNSQCLQFRSEKPLYIKKYLINLLSTHVGHFFYATNKAIS